MMKGIAIHKRVEHLEQHAILTDHYLAKTQEQLDFFIKTALPLKEGIFYEGEVFDAYVFVADLIKSAKKKIILIDNYLDESVLLLLSKRSTAVQATIYTNQISEQLKADIQKHNAQYPPIEIKIFAHSHDRFLLIDDEVYHI
jgi:hypothetical protein